MVTDPTNQSFVPLARHDLSDLGSDILIRIPPKERNISFLLSRSNVTKVDHTCEVSLWPPALIFDCFWFINNLLVNVNWVFGKAESALGGQSARRS